MGILLLLLLLLKVAFSPPLVVLISDLLPNRSLSIQRCWDALSKRDVVVGGGCVVDIDIVRRGYCRGS